MGFSFISHSHSTKRTIHISSRLHTLFFPLYTLEMEELLSDIHPGHNWFVTKSKNCCISKYSHFRATIHFSSFLFLSGQFYEYFLNCIEHSDFTAEVYIGWCCAVNLRAQYETLFAHPPTLSLLTTGDFGR